MVEAFSYPEGFYAGYHSQKPICGVLAVALAAGVTYDVAAKRCKEAMHDIYPTRQRFGGKTSTPQRELAMKRLGVKFERTDIVSKRPKLIDVVKTFEPDTMYHVVYKYSGGGHILTVRNGYIIDQARLTLIELSPCAKKRICEVTKIIGKGW